MLHLASDIIKGQTANSSHVAGSTLHTAYCTLHTVPAPVPVPVHFILHNDNWIYISLYKQHNITKLVLLKLVILHKKGLLKLILLMTSQHISNMLKTFQQNQMKPKCQKGPKISLYDCTLFIPEWYFFLHDRYKPVMDRRENLGQNLYRLNHPKGHYPPHLPPVSHHPLNGH